MKKYLKWKWSVHGLGLFMAIGFLIGSSALVPGELSKSMWGESSEDSTDSVLSDCSTFSTRSVDLIRMDSHFSGTSRSVVFNPDSARNAGFSEESILLAIDMASYSDAISKLNDGDDQPTKTSLVDWFFSCASSKLDSAAASEDETSDPVQILSQCTDSGYPEAACVCGNSDYPQPNRADNPPAVENGPNPNQALLDLHFARVYWPYAQSETTEYRKHVTYQSNYCGSNTFRQHAWVVDSDTYKIQRYSGWTPPGEPNPEVHLGGPWPYWVWPAYVLWWHNEF